MNIELRFSVLTSLLIANHDEQEKNPEIEVKTDQQITQLVMKKKNLNKKMRTRTRRIKWNEDESQENNEENKEMKKLELQALMAETIRNRS